MNPRISKKEHYLYLNTLACVPKAVEGKYTTVDLRNECSVTGKVTEVDCFMNMEMENALFIDARGTEHTFKTFFVRSRIIRFVHIPKSVDVEEEVRNIVEPKRRQPQKKVHTFKLKRAQKYHQETVNAAFAQQSTSST